MKKNLLLLMLLLLTITTQAQTIPVRGKIKFINNTSNILGPLVNTGSGLSEFQYIEFTRINDTCFTSSFSQDTICFPASSGSGESLWESHLSGIKPVLDETVYITNFLEDCSTPYSIPDTANAGAGDIFIANFLFGSYTSTFDVATITNNTVGVFDTDDGNELVVDYDAMSRGVFGVKIEINEACLPVAMPEIDSITFTIVSDVENFNIDSSNSVLVFITQTDGIDTFLYFNGAMQAQQFINNVNTIEITTPGTNMNLATNVFTPTGFNDNNEFYISFASTDSFSIDAILVDVYFAGSSDTLGVIGYNLNTGELISYDLNSLGVASYFQEINDTLSLVNDSVTFVIHPQNNLFLVSDNNILVRGFNDGVIQIDSLFQIYGSRIDLVAQAKIELTSDDDVEVVVGDKFFVDANNTAELNSPSIIFNSTDSTYINHSFEYTNVASENFSVNANKIINIQTDSIVYITADDRVEITVDSAISTISTYLTHTVLQDYALGAQVINLVAIDSMVIDLPTKGIGKILTDIDGSGTAEWSRSYAPIPFTPMSDDDANYLAGTITYDANYLYIKLEDTTTGMVHLWSRYANDITW